MAKSRKRLNYAVDMDEDFPMPNNTPAQLKRLAQEKEKKRLLAESSTRNFSILRGYTSTHNVARKSSIRSLLSSGSTSSRSHKSLKSEKNKSKTRKLSYGKKKHGNSDSNTITTVTEEGDDDDQGAQIDKSTHSDNGNTVSSSDKQEKEKKCIGRLVDLAKGGPSENQQRGIQSENSSLTSGSDQQSEDSGSQTDTEDNLDNSDDVSVDKESQEGSHKSKKSLDTYKTKNTQNELDKRPQEEGEEEEEEEEKFPKQKKLVLVAIVVTAIIIVAITIVMTVDGLKGLKEEVMQETYPTNNRTSMPTIYRTMHPTAGPRFKLDSSDRSIPSMTPSNNMKAPSLPIAPAPNRKRGSSATISPTVLNTMMPSFSPPVYFTNEPSINQHTSSPSMSIPSTVYPSQYPTVSPTVLTTLKINIPVSQSSQPKIATERNKKWNITTTLSTPFFDEYRKSENYRICQSHDGSRMAISIPFANYSIGVVIIYDYVQNEWVEIQKISGSFRRDTFGYSMSLSSDGKAIAIAGNGQNRNGYVQVYSEASPELWKQMGTNLQMSSEGARRANFGFSISLVEDGKFIAIGAPFATRNGLSSCGRVEFFSFNELDGKWSSFGQGLDGESKSGLFGFSVDLARNFVIVGAPRSSYVRVFKMKENTMTDWVLFGEDIHGKQEKDFFGQTVSISSDGHRICIGAPMNNDIGTRSGVVYVYDLIDSYFRETGGYIYGSNLSEYGQTLSLSGDGEKIIIGGSVVRLYSLQAGVWKGTTLDVEKNIENFVVNISSDGNRIAVIAQPGEAVSLS